MVTYQIRYAKRKAGDGNLIGRWINAETIIPLQDAMQDIQYNII